MRCCTLQWTLLGCQLESLSGSADEALGMELLRSHVLRDNDDDASNSHAKDNVYCAG